MIKTIITIVIAGIASTSSATIINIPADWPTIQAGIAYSNDGDTVLVQPGLYYEPIDYYGHNVIVGSLFLTTGDTSYIFSTIIDGNGSWPVIILQSGEDGGAALIGFTIRNGYSYNGGGIGCINGSSPVIRNNLIIDNVGYRNCGGIYCLNSSNPLIENNHIVNNSTAHYGGGIYVISSSPVIVNNMITGNSAFQGGGIYAIDCQGLILSGNTITANTPGGADCNGSDIIILNNAIYSNDMAGDGGGLELGESSALVIGNKIIDNNCRNFGGGLDLWRSTATILNNIISGNSAGSHGGGISLMQSEAFVINNIITGNSVEGFIASGGGIYMVSSTCITTNLIVRGNTVNDSISQISTFDCTVEPTFTNIEGGWPGTGNIDIDPLFRNPDNGDFHLMSIACGDSADSPCIDAGDPAILDSLLDCSWGLGGTRSDMGAFGGGDSVTVGIFDDMPSLPDRFMLLQNYPNPFNGQTTIRFALQESQYVKLSVYDLLGRRIDTIIDEYRQTGVHTITFDASDLSSGVYFYRLQAGDRIETKRMVLLK